VLDIIKQNTRKKKKNYGAKSSKKLEKEMYELLDKVNQNAIDEKEL